MDYRISVIMGIYNCADTLPEALDSLLAQTYRNFKVIMCDDGSSDNTHEVALKYVEQYENFILIKNSENKGLNLTLNRCLELADTEFIARMDGDDISIPNRFEKEVAILDSKPEISIVSSAMNYFDENGIYMTSKSKEYPVNLDFIKGTPFCHAPCMVRKVAYDAVNGYTVDKKLLRVEDVHLWFKMYAKGFKGYNINEPLYNMRDDRNAYSRRKLKYRVNEMYVKSIGYRMLDLPFYYQIYVLKPILTGLLPKKMYLYIRKLSHK
jgi:glycosyltransferase EpsE